VFIVKKIASLQKHNEAIYIKLFYYPIILTGFLLLSWHT